MRLFRRRRADGGSSAGSDSAGTRLTIGRRLGMLVGALVIAVAVVAGIGALGIGQIDQRIHTFYEGTFARAGATADLRGDVNRLEVASLEYALVEHRPRRAKLETEIPGTLVPAVDSTLAVVVDELGSSSEPAATRVPLDRLRRNWQLYRERQGPALFAASLDGEQAVAEKIKLTLDRVVDDAALLADGQATQASDSIQDTGEFTDSTQRGLLGAALIAGLVAIGIAIALTRRLVLRTRDYSRFAGGVATGNFDDRVELRGNDELTDLGRLLNQMVEHHDADRRHGLQRAEFTEAMQLTGTESDAHTLLKRHLERAIPGSEVAVLSRNNSADRLEPTTELSPDHPGADGLLDASPQDCLAVRSGQAQRHDGSEKLLSCEICGEGKASACQPLLVGGEVIGAVLACRDGGLTESESETMRGSVTQAAPLLANLRNLALAELRAGTDSLTGLPNQRASHETLQRMAAQAQRSQLPLSILMLDLDRFKQINDVFGHAAGDDVLATVGLTLPATVRTGDFCGRFGGEEFIVLLPDTDLPSAEVVAEKIRASVAAITVSAVRREITISVGIATIPDHGTDIETVSRLADRALYTAKAHGRNCTEVAAVGGSDVELDAHLDATPTLP